MTKEQINVGFLVSYDWYLLKNSLLRVYQDADIIFLALDKKRITWSGNPFAFDEQSFKKMIAEMDVNQKIHLYEDDFYLPELTPIQCDNRERTLLAKQMGEGGWHIQIDSDEYLLDFNGFTKYLLKLNPDPQPKQKPINVCCNFINLIKKTERGFIMDNFLENQSNAPIATNVPIYEAARRNGHSNHISPFLLFMIVGREVMRSYGEK